MVEQRLDSAAPDGAAEHVVGYREETGRYRRPPGGWWWAALVGVPLILALVGTAMSPGTNSSAVTAASATAASSVTTTAATATSASASSASTTTTTSGVTPYGLTRSGSTVTITGSFPDEAARTAAVQAFKTAVGTGLVVVDQTTVAAGSPALAPAQATALGAAAAGVTDFSVKTNGTTITLAGTAISEDAKAAAEKAAKDAFPSATVVNSITVATAQGCTTLSSQVATFLAGNKLQFAPASVELTDASKAAVAHVATLLKTCASAKVAINGYTDNQGSDANSVPLSQGRANTVRDALVAAGVTNTITATGFGSTNPVGDNNTDAGRAANRRVEIVIS